MRTFMRWGGGREKCRRDTLAEAGKLARAVALTHQLQQQRQAKRAPPAAPEA
jgi:hypothetical protein